MPGVRIVALTLTLFVLAAGGAGATLDAKKPPCKPTTTAKKPPAKKCKKAAKPRPKPKPTPKPVAPKPQLRLTMGYDVAVEPAGTLLVADGGDNRIWRLDPTAGAFTLVGGNGVRDWGGDGGPATQAPIGLPRDLELAADGTIYVAASGNRVRKIEPSGVVSTVYDGGPSDNVGPGYVFAIALDGRGGLYMAQGEGTRISRVDLATGAVTHVAGDGRQAYGGDGGPAVAASFSAVHGLLVAPDGSLIVADNGNQRVRRIDLPTGIVTTIAGTGVAGVAGDGGPALQAQLNNPGYMAYGLDGALYIEDFGNGRVRRLRPDGVLETAFRAANVGGFAFAADGSVYFVSASSTFVLRWSPVTGATTRVGA